jgi:hypothetical protein
MKVIDCDAPVEEAVETWQYLEPDFYLLRPTPVTLPEDTSFGSRNAAFRQDQLANGLRARGDLSERTMKKILAANPQRLFHFS